MFPSNLIHWWINDIYIPHENVMNGCFCFSVCIRISLWLISTLFIQFLCSTPFNQGISNVLFWFRIKITVNLASEIYHRPNCSEEVIWKTEPKWCYSLFEHRIWISFVGLYGWQNHTHTKWNKVLLRYSCVSYPWSYQIYQTMHTGSVKRSVHLS